MAKVLVDIQSIEENKRVSLKLKLRSLKQHFTRSLLALIQAGARTLQQRQTVRTFFCVSNRFSVFFLAGYYEYTHSKMDYCGAPTKI